MIELLMVIGLVCAVYIVSIICIDLWNDITENDDTFDDHPDMKSYGDSAQQLFSSFPVLLFGGSIVCMIISSFFTDSHPIFLAISIIMFVVSIPLMAILSNSTMGIVTSDPDWEQIATDNEMGTNMVGNMVLWGIMGGILVMMALYAKLSR